MNEPGKQRDLASLASRKKIHQQPLDNLCLSVWFFHFIRVFCGAGCLSQGEGGAKREEFKVKREPYSTGAWGRNSQLA